ncbi:MAG TPA: polysaccharide biosynthesis/export family protein [Candidatus Acidoferrales bacterium]|nr:polysaccharide biosynthesis/export family protein [Candidatus Acidoferrales bacterium]
MFAPALLTRSFKFLALSSAALLLGALTISQPAHAFISADGGSGARQSTAPATKDETPKKSGSKKTPKDTDSTHNANPNSADQASTAYRIGVADQIQISVWREHDLSLAVVVRPDGVITMPLLNDIYVVGMTPKELADSLTEKLKPFVNEPQVTVSVQQIQSRKVYLIGNAARQGAFQLNDNKTVLELIAEAGGVTQFAKTNSIYILRIVNGSEVRIPVRYKDAINGKGKDELLMPGDKVVIP